MQRTLKFTRYLPETGWLPLVLTVENSDLRLPDSSLLEEIPAYIEVEHTQACLLPAWLPWQVRNWVARWILVIDGQVGWIPFAVNTGKQIVQEKSPRAIYTTSAPYSSHLIGLLLKRSTHLPWIADFRDPWIDNFSSSFPTRLHKKISEQFEKMIIRRADSVLVVSEPMRTNLITRLGQEVADKITTITNGYDPNDFNGLSPALREISKFTIVYTGSFYGRQQTPEPFLQSLSLAISEGLIPEERLCLRFVGNSGKLLPKLIERLGLNHITEIMGYCPHRHALSQMLAADILLLIIGSGPHSDTVFTGKIFEYLAAQKMILCLAGQGAASSLITEAKAGVIVAPDDIVSIEGVLVQLFHDWEKSELKITPDAKVVSRYNRQIQTNQLAELLNKITRTANT